MRFMVIVKANPQSEASEMDPQIMTEMSRFNEELVKAGVMVSGEGLHPSSKGSRIIFPPGKGKPIVKDGPFSETKELVAGFWIIQTKSKEEAVEWFKRCPTTAEGGELEIRQVYETDELPDEVFSAEEKAKEHALRAQLEAKAGR